MDSWNVLLVDDESMVLNVHGQMVNRMGHVATMFDCPVEALSYMQDKGDEIDLVITDYRMPTLSGLEFIRELRRMNAHVPVLMLTAYSSDIGLQEAASYGVEVIDKPVRLAVLSAYIEEMRERFAARSLM